MGKESEKKIYNVDLKAIFHFEIEAENYIEARRIAIESVLINHQNVKDGEFKSAEYF